MKGTLCVNGKTIEIDISDEDLKKFFPEKKTGYERAEGNDRYFCILSDGFVINTLDRHINSDNILYDTANYYTDHDLAARCSRADTLYRNLRRFTATNREKEIDWDSVTSEKYFIRYTGFWLEASSFHNTNSFGTIYFDSKATAQAAINLFRDELMWYFTEFKDTI